MWHTQCCTSGLRVVVVFSWHGLSHFCVSLPLSQDIVKDPKFILGGATRTDICQGDLGEWFPLGGRIHAYTPWGAAGISSHMRGCCPSWTGRSSEAGGTAHAHLAHRHLFGSTLPSVPGAILVQLDSKSGRDLHARELWAQGSLLSTSTSRLQHSLCPGWAGTCCLGTHGFGFQEQWQLTAITCPLASTPPSPPEGKKIRVFSPFSIHRWLLAISSHSFSHTEWKNTSKSGATGSKFWARLCWNISLPGKMNIWY